MKVGLLVRRFGPFGGMEKVAYGFAHWLAEQGYDVDVLSDEFVSQNTTIKHRPLGAGGRGALWKARNLSLAMRCVSLDTYDGFLSFERGGLASPYRAGGGCHAAYRKNCGGGLGGAYLEHIDRLTCRRARPLIVNSQMVFDEMRALYGVERTRLRLVRNGVDLDRFQPSNQFSEPTAVFVGSDARRKGLMTALRAIALVPDVRLLVLGQVSNRFRRAATDLGLSGRVEFKGWVERPEELVPKAHVMVLPTHYDPSSNAALEALASGVPVITTKANGASEVLPVPWLVLDNPMDAEGCARVLSRALNDVSLAQACRAAAEAQDLKSSYSHLLDTITEEPS